MNDADEWQKECETAVLLISNLLYAAGRRSTTAPVIELIRQMPSVADPDQGVERETLFVRCGQEAVREGGSWSARNQEELKEFMLRISKMSSERRKLLEASIVGSLLGFSMAKY